MNRVIETINGQLRSAVPAANADQLGELEQAASRVQVQDTVDVTSTASGWDSYEVWRRFIKDARDRRLGGRA
ncbi:MAG TPA: hypothetical protein VGN07_11620 [Steroidobacteraceae bacterium]